MRKRTVIQSTLKKSDVMPAMPSASQLPGRVHGRIQSGGQGVRTTPGKSCGYRFP